MNQSALAPQANFGFGCMRLPQLSGADVTDSTAEGAIDIEQTKQMVDAFLAAGGTYFDTAYIYGGGASERALREALVERYPRDAYTVATKCMAWAEPNAAAAKRCLDVSLERLGLDYVDFYLLHNVGGKRVAKFDAYGIWEWVLEEKAAGRIRHVGFSMHDGPEMLEQLLCDHPEMEFVQLQVNYLDWDDPVTQSRRCMEVAAAHGKPVIIMEPARGGRLCTLPERAAAPLRACRPDLSLASWAYRFCYNLPNVHAVLSGASTLEQMEENAREWQANQPFSAEEEAALAASLAELRSVPQIPCTNCQYCVKGCPQGVKIPETFALMNLEAMIEDHEFVAGLFSWQTREGRPSACIQCGACEDMCPQQIAIIDELQRAVAAYENS